MTDIAGYIGLLTLFGLSIFQAALILKAPIARYAWGGQHTVLPNKLRVASCISIILYVLFAIFISSKAGIVVIINIPQILHIGIWVISIYFWLGIVMNAISRSKSERYTMTPIAAILAITFTLVALA